MTLADMQARSGSRCELCAGGGELAAHEVAESPADQAEITVLICAACSAQLQLTATPDPQHWRCLNTSIWSPVPAVQVLAWRMLRRLRDEAWAADLLETAYLDDETLAWARAEASSPSQAVIHRDGNGAVLAAGDTVTLSKDLPVRGAGFTAKRGTAVRGISLVPDNPAQIEGRVNGQRIVILTEFVKKST